jgi:hypothetical protein
MGEGKECSQAKSSLVLFLAHLLALNLALGFTGLAFLGLDAFTGLALTILGGGVWLSLAGVALGFLLGALEAAFSGMATFFTYFLVFMKTTGLLESSLENTSGNQALDGQLDLGVCVLTHLVVDFNIRLDRLA